MGRIRNCFSVVFVVFLLVCGKNAWGNKYPQVFFDNGLMKGFYGHSLVSYSGSSWVENIKGHLPLSEFIFYTPGNALSLKYTSSKQGYWETSIVYPSRERYILDAQDKFFKLKIKASKFNGKESLPHIKLNFADTCTQDLPLSKYIGKIDTIDWVKVSVPIKDFNGLKVGDQIHSITFSQAELTGINEYNHIYLDQLEFGEEVQNKLKLSFPAILSETIPFEKHVELHWQLPLNPSIKYVKIYRSLDGENFNPIGQVPVFVSHFLDFVPETNRRYYYKIAWVDVDYDESPFSKVLSAFTQPMDDSEYLNVMQKSHLQYFLENIEINSGMHAISQDKRKALVSVEETGYSILSKVVGVEREFLSKTAFVTNLKKLTNFLMEAEHYKGVFPRYLDGRSGKSMNLRNQNTKYNLNSTSQLFVGLLVANQYLYRHDWEELNLHHQVQNIQESITELWNRIDWKFFYNTDHKALYESFDKLNEFKDQRLLGGLGADFLPYLLSASQRSELGLPKESYLEGIMYFRASDTTLYPFPTDVINPDIPLIGDFSLMDEGGTTLVDSVDNIILKPIFKDTIAYGIQFELGNHLNRNLLETYSVFLALNPLTFQDSILNYGVNITKLTDAYRRRDNEMNVGNAFFDIWGTAQNISYQNQNANWAAIFPSIPIASYVFNEEEGMKSIKRLYHQYGDMLLTETGFRNWFNLVDNTVSDTHRGLSQGLVVVMLENARTGLIWDLFTEFEDIAILMDHINIYDQ